MKYADGGAPKHNLNQDKDEKIKIGQHTSALTDVTVPNKGISRLATTVGTMSTANSEFRGAAFETTQSSLQNLSHTGNIAYKINTLFDNITEVKSDQPS